MKLNGLEKYFETMNGEIIDFKQLDKDGYNPLLISLLCNKSENLNLSNEQLDCLIKNSDLKQVDKYAKSSLIYALSSNKSQNLNLSNEQLDYLIKNSDLKQVTKNGWSTLKFALEYNKSQNLNLNIEQWKYIIKNSNLSLIKEDIYLIELKKIQSVLINDDILSKLDINKEIKKNNKI